MAVRVLVLVRVACCTHAPSGILTQCRPQFSSERKRLRIT